MRKYIVLLASLVSFTTLLAQEHTRFMDLPLSLSPEEMVRELENRGLQQEDVFVLTGRFIGFDVRVRLHCSEDSSSINSLVLSTQRTQGHSQRSDWSALMKWLRKHYGSPTWESTVRSHLFARWWVGYDRDIVMICTAKPSIEIWFYDNHKKRHFDYYSILKYCERNPVDEIPYLTADENVTWKRNPIPVKKVTNTKATKSRKASKKAARKSARSQSRSKSKSKTKSHKARGRKR